jgi:hypothetical protein
MTPFPVPSLSPGLRIIQKRLAELTTLRGSPILQLR